MENRDINEISEEKSQLDKRIIIWVLTAVVAIVVIIGFLFIKLSADKDRSLEGSKIEKNELGNSTKEISTMDSKRTNIHNIKIDTDNETVSEEYEGVISVINNYMLSTSVEQRYQYIRKSNVDLESYSAYYNEHPLEDYEGYRLQSLNSLRKGDNTLYQIILESDSKPSQTLVVSKSKDSSYLVLWGYLDEFQSEDVKEFLSDEGEAVSLFRVIAAGSDFYTSRYTEEKYISLQIVNMGDSIIYAFFPRENKKLLSLVRLLRRFNNKDVRMMLVLKKVSDDRGLVICEVLDIASLGWILLDEYQYDEEN